MYFIPYTKNRIYNWFAPIKPSYRYSITLFIVLLVTYGWMYGIYAKISQRIEQHRSEINQLYKKCNVIKQTENAEADQKQSLASLQDAKQKVKALSATEHDLLQTRVKTLFDTAQKTGLILTEYAIGKEHKKEWYSKEKAQFVFTGTLKQLQNWLYDLAASPALIQCKQLTISRLNNEQFTINCAVEITKVS